MRSTPVVPTMTPSTAAVTVEPSIELYDDDVVADAVAGPAGFVDGVEVSPVCDSPVVGCVDGAPVTAGDVDVSLVVPLASFVEAAAGIADGTEIDVPGSNVGAISPDVVCSRPRECPTSCRRTVNRSMCAPASYAGKS